MVSAHWETPSPSLTAGETNPTIHDFHGFPKELYDIRYPASGSAWLVDLVAALIEGEGGTVTEEDRPLRVAGALPSLVSRLDQVATQHGVARDKLVLLGFSQGAIMVA